MYFLVNVIIDKPFKSVKSRGYFIYFTTFLQIFLQIFASMVSSKIDQKRYFIQIKWLKFGSWKTFYM